MASTKNLTRILRGVEYGSLSALILGIFGYIFSIFVHATYPGSPPALTDYFPVLLGMLGFGVGLAGGIRVSAEDLLEKIIEKEELRLEKDNMDYLKKENEAEKK